MLCIKGEMSPIGLRHSQTVGFGLFSEELFYSPPDQADSDLALS